MNLTPQHKQILEMLSDGFYHCPTIELYMKDDRARFSELKKGGYIILGDQYCDNKLHNHISKVKLRKLVATPEEMKNYIMPPKTVSKVFEHGKVCCHSFQIFRIHDRTCNYETLQKVIKEKHLF